MKFSMNSSRAHLKISGVCEGLGVPFEPKKIGDLPTVTVNQGLTYPQFPSMNQLFYNYTELGKRGR